MLDLALKIWQTLAQVLLKIYYLSRLDAETTSWIRILLKQVKAADVANHNDMETLYEKKEKNQ